MLQFLYYYNGYMNSTTVLGYVNRFTSNYLWHIVPCSKDSLTSKVVKITLWIFGIGALYSVLNRKFKVSQEQKAATKIQRAWRSARSREKSKAEVAPYLALHLVPGAKTLRKEVNQFLSTSLKEDTPKANNGMTRVYFPDEFPHIILKASNFNCCKRLEQMIFARNLCTELKTTSLVVPRALLNKLKMRDGIAIGDYLIEERLLIKDIADFEQQKLYMDNLEKATPAIQEFTHFIFRSGACDLSTQAQSFPKKCKQHPRYDNYPFFLTEKGELKIGLIDLETIDVKSNPTLATLYHLVYMYPYHKAAILEVARSYFSNIPSDEIDAWETSGKELLKISYIDLQAYLSTKVDPKIVLTPQVKSAILDEVTKEAHLTVEECRLIDQSLDLILEKLKTIKEKELKDRPFYYFNYSIINHPLNKLPGYCELEASLYDEPRKILKSNILLDYLLKKLVDHQVVYDVLLVGTYGTLVD